MVRRNRGFKEFRSLLTGIIFLSTLIGGIFLAYKLLPALSTVQLGKFGRFNVIVSQDPLSVVSVNSEKKEAVIVKFPDDLLVDAAYGYGKIPASKLYSVGQLDHRGDVVLRNSLADFLGLNLRSVVSTRKPVVDPSGKLDKLALLDPSVFKNLDALLLAVNLFQIRSDKLKVVDLASPEISVEIVLADGSRALFVEPEELDQFLGDSFFDSKLVSESLRVAIVNSTSVDGLGAKASRFLGNQGVNVVRVETREEEWSDCEIRFSKETVEGSKTLLLAKDYFRCQSVFDETLDSRFDLEIILGSTFARRFSPDGD